MLLENMKIDYNPLVLCNILFYPVKYNTDVKGYWIDDNGKVYADNILMREYTLIDIGLFYHAKEKLFKQCEKCVAFKNPYNELVLEYPNCKTEVLKNRIAWVEKAKPSQDYIKELLSHHGGLTVYRIDNSKYLIEIYK